MYIDQMNEGLLEMDHLKKKEKCKKKTTANLIKFQNCFTNLHPDNLDGTYIEFVSLLRFDLCVFLGYFI